MASGQRNTDVQHDTRRRITRGTPKHPWHRIVSYEDGKVSVDYFKFLKSGIWRVKCEDLPDKSYVRL